MSSVYYRCCVVSNEYSPIVISNELNWKYRLYDMHHKERKSHRASQMIFNPIKIEWNEETTKILYSRWTESAGLCICSLRDIRHEVKFKRKYSCKGRQNRDMMIFRGVLCAYYVWCILVTCFINGRVWHFLNYKEH